MRRRWTALSLFLFLVTGSVGVARSQIDIVRDVPCCHVDRQSVIWAGSDSLMTMGELAAHCAPILWFSPDEPLLKNMVRPDSIMIPTTFPFEEPSDRPVVYYRLRTLITREEARPFSPDSTDLNSSIVDLTEVSLIDIDYFFYYPSEEGLGGHVHDVESVEMKIVVFRQPNCSECRYALHVDLVNAKAHGILWYDNTLETDEYTEFPITVLVEEGKHASCTDKNGDGYFTPGYDVNRRINDAWGVRDVMRTGALFSGGFESWFAKVRRPRDRVFPPLPESNWSRQRIEEESGVYAEGYQTYELRTMPTVEKAKEYDVVSGQPSILRFVDKGHHDWPEKEKYTAVDELTGWIEKESFAKSVSVAFRVDNDLGVSVVFPLFVLKNYEDPITGGWLVNRIYFKDKNLRDFGWNVMYTSSASRWLDGYVSVGLEVDKEDGLDGSKVSKTYFSTESGIKFRANISHSPLKFLSPLTDFWGLRVGLQYRKYNPISDLGWVIEIGAGTF